MTEKEINCHEDRSVKATSPLLALDGFSIRYGEYVTAVSDVSLRVHRGEILGLIGESGCGKSSVALAALGLLPDLATVEADRFDIVDRSMRHASSSDWRAVRGRQAAMIFQEPMTALNPCMRIGDQIGEVIRIHRLMGKKEAREKSLGLLRSVGMPAPEVCLRQFPHQLSGGMRQRAMIASSLAGAPSLLIADEPTTALDVTVEAQVLQVLKGLQEELSLGVLFISHDLGVISRICDRVAVMYAGQIVEEGTPQELLESPLHPYTIALVDSIPGRNSKPRSYLSSISGTLSNKDRLTDGCRFASRCPYVLEECGFPQVLRPYGESSRSVRCWRADELSPNPIPIPSGDCNG